METALTGCTAFCEAARGFDEASGSHCISSTLLSVEKIKMKRGGKKREVVQWVFSAHDSAKLVIILIF